MARLEIGCDDCLFASIGQRAYDRLMGAGLPVEENIMVPSSPTGIPAAVQDLIEIIDRWSTVSRISRVILEYNHHLSGAAYEPVTARLLPLDQEWLRELRSQPWPTKELPIFRMEADTLFSHLVKHYLISSLFQAFAESLASENASRLAAMQGAEKNIRDRIVELKNQYHQERQVSITEELLDIVSGFNVLEGKEL
jgi:F-type H+-transporting ATPase subunit gamma